MDRKLMLFLGFVLQLAVSAAGPAHADGQEYPPPPPPPVQAVPAPAPDVVVAPPPPQGQWVQTAEYGLVWIPANTVTYAVGDTPCAYLYTPTYGWTWYASPWGAGRFAIGAWATRPSPYGHRAWVHGPRGWGWHRGPRVEVRVAPPRRAYGPGYPQTYGRGYPQTYGRGYPQASGRGYPQTYGRGYPQPHPGYRREWRSQRGHEGDRRGRYDGHRGHR